MATEKQATLYASCNSTVPTARPSAVYDAFLRRESRVYLTLPLDEPAVEGSIKKQPAAILRLRRLELSLSLADARALRDAIDEVLKKPL